jgi:hypothetical protein
MTTVVFVGVTTGSSLVHQAIAEWQPLLGMACNVRGVDIALDADDETYVRFLRDLLTDDSAAGAVITTHKVGLFRAGRILFAGLDPLALACEEVNAIRLTPDGLRGWARDPVSVGRVADQIWPESEGEVVCWVRVAPRGPLPNTFSRPACPRDSSAPIRSAPPSSTSLARRKASSPDTSAMGLGMTSSKLRRPGR